MSGNPGEISIKELGLSVRSVHGLTKIGVETAEDLMTVTEEQLLGVRNLGRKSVDEILEKIAELSDGTEKYEKKARQGVYGLIDDPETTGAVIEYVKNNDVFIKDFGLSNRSRNQLLRNGYDKISDIAFMSKSDLEKIPALGATSISEILSVIDAYFYKNEKRIFAFCSGDASAVTDDDTIKQNILELYEGKGFSGLSMKDITEGLDLPEAVTEDRIKGVIGKLIAEGELEYVDFWCHRVYPKFEDVLAKTPKIDDRNREFVNKRLAGITLEAIGQEAGLTREGVRQVVNKGAKKVADYNYTLTGLRSFDEDYYEYFYKTYAFEKKDGSKWLGVSDRIWNYLDMMGVKRGEKPLKDALEDSDNLDLGFRLKIKNYLNRNRLFLDGEWVDKKRESLERFVIRKLCKDDVSFNGFVEKYNDFLQKEGIEFDPDIYITEDVYATRKNRVTDMTCLLWKQNEKLRYYDIEGRDFAELFDTLNLASYENIEISTAKLMWEHPEVMEKYDIRDQYELHNLLRKTIKEGEFNGFRCNRMPNIVFGQFDRDEAILQIMIDNAPVSQDKIVDIIHEEYGYDKATILGSYLIPIYRYYNDGIYSIDQKTAPDYQLDLLGKKLTGNFYYFDEIRNIYKKLFEDADPEAINPYTLKKMGFNVYTRYALKGYSSLETFFNELLTKDDVVNISGLRKRYTYVTTFTNKLMELKRNLQVIEFEPNMLINMRKLEKAGVSKEMIRDYCDAVYQFIGEDEFFSAKSLKDSGFESDLYDLGFSDWFYGNLLISDPRFSFGNMFGNLIFKKGKCQITVKDFAYDIIRQYEVIDRYDLMSEMNDRYGCSAGDFWDIYYKVQDTGVYYDKILDRVYLNEDLYYAELDETEDL